METVADYLDVTIERKESKSVQVGVVSYKQELAIRKLELENDVLKEQNKKMQEQVSKHKTKARKLIEEVNSSEFKRLEDVQRLAAQGNVKAIFILDQINNFDKRQPTWSTETLQHCSEWRDASGKGYAHVTSRKFLSCPSRSTLERFARDEDVQFEEPMNVSEVTIEIHPSSAVADDQI